VHDEKFVRFLRHPCAKGLEAEAAREIADAATLIEIDTNEILHRAQDPVKHLFLVSQGRLKTSMLAVNGEELIQRFLTRGQQFGALAGAQVEPFPITVTATEPSKLLRIDYQQAIALGAKHPTFQINLIRLIGSEVAKTLFLNRVHSKPSVVAMLHQSPTSRELTERLLVRLVDLEHSVCVLSDREEWSSIPGVHYAPIFQDGHLISRAQAFELFQRWADRGRIVIDTLHNLDNDEIQRVVSFSEQVFWCVQRDNYRQATTAIQALKTQVDSWREKINVVWLLDRDDRCAPKAPELMNLVSADFKVSISPPTGNSGNQLINGLERIIHHLRGIRIGIALGGGGAKGMAHLGVLDMLEKNGVVVDMIAGTSAGAMTGTVHAAGLETDFSIQSFMKDLKPSWLFRSLPSGGHWYLLYKYRTGQFDPMLRKYLSDVRIEQLPIPMHTVTVDLVSGQAIVRSAGDAVDGILESINLPVLSLPICRPGQALVDGGLVNNVPADVLIKRGCNFVIAVSVTAKLEKKFMKITPASTRVHRRPSTLQTILRSYLVQNVNMNSVGVQPADIVIEPEVLKFGLAEFTRTDELASAGARATEAALPEIRRLLAQLDRKLFMS
jgi:NTE family protein